MSGIVAVCCHELSRFASFTGCISNLRKPEGTVVTIEQGMNVALNRQAVARQAIATDAEWVFFVDDDMLFPPDQLERLLAHNLDVVASLYLNRNPAFYPMAFGDSRVQDGKTGWRPVALRNAPAAGLANVVAAGTGGMLVKTDVFRAIPYDTWFQHEGGTEDLPFCERVIAAGYKIYVDLEAVMGHVSTYAVWPTWSGEVWKAGIALTNDHMLVVEIGE